MRSTAARSAWPCGHVLLVLLAGAVALGTSGQPLVSVVVLGAATLVAGVSTLAAPILSAWAVDVAGTRLRAWGHVESEISRAEEANRAGRPHPRAPGARRAALAV